MIFGITQYFLHHKGDLFLIKKTLKESNKPIIENWKKALKPDLVLKKQGIFYFLEKIEEAQIIEENNESIKTITQ